MDARAHCNTEEGMRTEQSTQRLTVSYFLLAGKPAEDAGSTPRQAVSHFGRSPKICLMTASNF